MRVLTCLRPVGGRLRGACLRVLLLATFAAVAVLGPAHALTIEGKQVLFRGTPVFVKGAMYYQPYAYHQYFWEEWDREQFVRDLDTVEQHGFNTLALQVNWGSFAARVDPVSGASEWNEEAFADLRFALQRLSERGLLAILWTGTARAPEGVGANHNPEWTDAGGRTHAAYDGYLIHDWPAIAANDAAVWRAMLEFHRGLAEACAGFDNVLYDPLDWQHLNINYWSFGDSGNLAAWREWLRSRNPELQHWNERSGENNATWEEVLLPVDEWVENTTALLGPPYKGRARDAYEGTKWADFRDWHDALCNSINAQIVAAIRAGDPDAVIGQRIDLWHYGDFRQRTWAPAGVDFICHGMYPDSVEQVSAEEVRKQIRMVRERTPRPLPILFWEVGLNPSILADEQRAARLEPLQAQWFQAVESAAREERLLGFCWWVWQDYYMGEAAMHLGLFDVDGERGK